MSEFRNWWHAPITAKDRSTGLMAGLFAGFWLCLLARLGLGAGPVTIVELAA